MYGFGLNTILKPQCYINQFTNYITHMLLRPLDMKELEKNKLVIRTIVGEAKNGMVRVIVSRDALGAIIQTNQAQYNKTLNPVLPFTDEIDRKLQDIRVFTFADDMKVCSFYDRVATGKSFFFMKTENAEKCLMTLAQERKNLPKLDLDVSEFDLDIVSSASEAAA